MQDSGCSDELDPPSSALPGQGPSSQVLRNELADITWNTDGSILQVPNLWL